MEAVGCCFSGDMCAVIFTEIFPFPVVYSPSSPPPSGSLGTPPSSFTSLEELLNVTGINTPVTGTKSLEQLARDAEKEQGQSHFREVWFRQELIEPV